jgi:16S rRNA (uracil1498-N3)-methyltransferase
MSRRRVRLPLSGLRAGPMALPTEAAHYLLRVHRLGPGDRFVAFDPDAALEADAELLPREPPAGEALGNGARQARSDGASAALRRRQGGIRRVSILVGEPRPASLRPGREVTLVQGLGKGDKTEAVVRDATELGVRRFMPVATERSVRRPSRAEVPLERWRRIAQQAARQCGRGDVPAILPLTELDAALGRLAPLAPSTLGLCLHPEGDEALGAVLAQHAACREVIVLVGPEGGFSPAEIARARELGFRVVALGPLVLRTETACAAVMGALLGGLPSPPTPLGQP